MLGRPWIYPLAVSVAGCRARSPLAPLGLTAGPVSATATKSMLSEMLSGTQGTDGWIVRVRTGSNSGSGSGSRFFSGFTSLLPRAISQNGSQRNHRLAQRQIAPVSSQARPFVTPRSASATAFLRCLRSIPAHTSNLSA